MRGVKFVDLGLQYAALREEILGKIDAIAKTGAYVLGPEVEEFERSFALYCGVRHAVAVGNGSDALMLPLLALGVGSGDEVITAPNSFVASAWVIARTGARIVFADVGEDMNLDPAKVAAAITARTKAIMPVHLTGRVADMDGLLALARQHDLIVIEDAAQAVGASQRGRRAGAFGRAAGFSLHPLKNLHVMGDGGIITTDDESLFRRLLKYRNHGLKDRDECEFWGVNSRLDAIQAGIASIKLPHLDGWNARHRAIADIYSAQLEKYVTVPRYASHEIPVFHRYMIQTPRRDELAAFLASRGVETKVNYPLPLHLHAAAKDLGYRRGDFPVAERLAATILSLPVYPELTDDAVGQVAQTIRQFFEQPARGGAGQAQ
jgi:dTDP-4-amino-4,6-dideoxygalactose transaminase